MKRGSALILAIWLIAILSIIVVSFSLEARLQAGINIFVRERSRVNHLIDAGKVIGEVVLLNFKEVQEKQESEDLADLLEKDRWLLEKRDLKKKGSCVISNVLIDEEHPDSGVVTIEITTEQCAKEGALNGININLLSKEGGDTNYQERWWMIFKLCGIPEELDTQEEGRIKLWNRLIASWDDWRDADDTPSAVELEECGAEEAWYKEEDDDKKIDTEYRTRPRNGPIPSIKELRYVRGFRDYPAILTGGVLNEWEDESQQIRISQGGILKYLDTEGGMKININKLEMSGADLLSTIPGVYADIEDDDCLDEAMTLAKAIIQARHTPPQDTDEPDNDEWPFKDFADLEWRLNNNDIGDESGEAISFDRNVDRKADEYFEYSPEENTQFSMKITGWSGGIERFVTASCYIKDGKVFYTDWQESPKNGCP